MAKKTTAGSVTGLAALALLLFTFSAFIACSSGEDAPGSVTGASGNDGGSDAAGDGREGGEDGAFDSPVDDAMDGAMHDAADDASRDGEALDAGPDGSPPNGIAPYSQEEIVLTGGDHSNPYVDVTFDGVFTGPGGVVLRVPGFWDGGNTWKLRFSPTLVGTWVYTTESNDALLDGQTGSIACTGAPERGWIVRDPDHEHGFMWAGSHDSYILLGDTWWGALSSGIGEEKFPMDAFEHLVDVWSDAGYSLAYSMLSSWNPAMTGWMNEGGEPWAEESGKYDLSRPNPAFFQAVDQRIAYANEHGIAMVLVLTESKNQIQDLEVYERFGRYALARWATSNVSIWPTGEFDDSEGAPFTVADWNELGDALQAQNPYGHPISIHPLHSTAQAFGDQAWHDYIVQQGTPSNAWTIEDLGHGKPVLSSEFYMGWDSWEQTPEWELRRAWEVLMAGGYFCSGHPKVVYANSMGWDGPEAQSTTFLQYLSVMRDFFSSAHSARFNERIEANALVSDGFAYRVEEEEVVVYRESPGTSTLDLSGTTGTFHAEAVNLRTGAVEPMQDVSAGGSVQLATPASGHEWALRLYR